MDAATGKLWQCVNKKCGVLLREPDLRSVNLPTSRYPVCPQCGDWVVTVSGKSAAESETGDPKLFFASVLSALVYPFRGWGLVVLLVGTLIIGLMNFGAPFLYSYVINLLVYGYVCNYLFNIVLTTANGADKPPDFPDFSNWWEDILQPLLLMVGTTLYCFAPALIYFLLYLAYCYYQGWIPQPDEPLCAGGVVSLAFLSLLYYPMALLAVAMFTGKSGLNPRIVIPAIFRVLGPYLVVCAFLAIVVAGQILFRALLDRQSLLAHFAAEFLFLCGLMICMRLLGVLYRTHKGKLGWF